MTPYPTLLPTWKDYPATPEISVDSRLEALTAVESP